MSAALMEAPASLFAAQPRAAGGRRATLEELLEGRWQSARSEGTTECPVCTATMHLSGGEAHCSDCGTTLS